MKLNRPNWRVINDDIANISCLDLEDYFQMKKGDLDLLSGGAPCQSFSYAGKRLGLEDARGTLFYHYATFLQKLQPKMFLFENVRGLLTHDKGRTYATITYIFEEAGYTIRKKVLNAWDFGVPQKRERLITIGIRNDLLDKVHFEFPKAHDYKPILYGEKLESYDLKTFNSNLIDPIKLIFDKSVYRSSWEEIINNEKIVRKLQAQT